MPRSTVDQRTFDAAHDALRHADHILIGAGAGLSTAEGLAYDGPRFERLFSAFIERYGITDMYSAGFYPFSTLADYWAYWSLHIDVNRYDVPESPLYQALVDWAVAHDTFVITTNVDAQFSLAGMPDDRIFAPQGDYGLFQCSRGCHPRTYPNHDAVKAMLQDTQHGQRTTLTDQSLIPYCPVCGAPMSVNVRCDATFVEDDAWHLAEQRHRRWLASACGTGSTVLLELGVGWNTPVWIRYPFEHIAQQTDATLIRINADPTTMRPSTTLDGRS